MMAPDAPHELTWLHDERRMSGTIRMRRVDWVDEFVRTEVDPVDMLVEHARRCGALHLLEQSGERNRAQVCAARFHRMGGNVCGGRICLLHRPAQLAELLAVGKAGIRELLTVQEAALG